MPTFSPTPVYVFQDLAAADAFLSVTEGREGTDSAPVAGWTRFYSSGRTRIQILEWLTFSGGAELHESDTSLRDTAIHEVGHVLDVQFGLAVDRAWVSLSAGTLPGSFSQILAHDFRNLPYGGPSYNIPKDPCGTGGMFDSDPNVCSSGQVTSTYSGMDNMGILQLLIPYFFTIDEGNPDTQEFRWLELWAEGFAVSQGERRTASVPSYIRTYFPCTLQYIGSQRTTGTVAASSSYPTSSTD
jgi:hypothetical protein